jgi:thiol:disulfide interchange protein DsbD
MIENLLSNLAAYAQGTPVVAFIAVFCGGILVSLTPCVYPVIPITVSYIGASSAGSRGKAFLFSLCYVVGMAITYAALGAFAALTGSLFGTISTSPIVYFIVGNICLLLGLSMLGVFELPMPGFLQRQKAPLAKGKGIIPSLLIGMASGLVVGPCTAPPLAVILAYVATKQNLLFGMALLFVFALGMGLLLILLGTFTGLLTSLPRAGTWLERIKKVFGWMLLLVGEYFLITMGKLLI